LSVDPIAREELCWLSSRRGGLKISSAGILS
jgi:hypothetical protein